MKTFLMCEPKYFDVSYIINPWMKSNIGRINKILAQKQWEDLYTQISQHALINLITPVYGLPDMVFTANAGLIKQHQEVIISTFRHPERQGESAHFTNYFSTAGYQIKQLSPGTIFEGAGDALFDSAGELWVGSGPRSDAAARKDIANTFQVKTHSLTLTDSRWYHLDTAFCPLTDGFVLAYKGAFSNESAIKIQEHLGNKVIWVSDEDASNFACNAVCLDHEVILYRASEQLKSILLGYNFKVIEIDVSEFLKSGGSCKCMTLEM